MILLGIIFKIAFILIRGNHPNREKNENDLNDEDINSQHKDICKGVLVFEDYPRGCKLYAA